MRLSPFQIDKQYHGLQAYTANPRPLGTVPGTVCSLPNFEISRVYQSKEIGSLTPRHQCTRKTELGEQKAKAEGRTQQNPQMAQIADTFQSA